MFQEPFNHSTSIKPSGQCTLRRSLTSPLGSPLSSQPRCCLPVCVGCHVGSAGATRRFSTVAGSMLDMLDGYRNRNPKKNPKTDTTILDHQLIVGRILFVYVILLGCDTYAAYALINLLPQMGSRIDLIGFNAIYCPAFFGKVCKIEYIMLT